LDSKDNLPVQNRDFLTYIEEYNIEFIIIDAQRLPVNAEFSRILQRVYGNDKFILYTIKR
jgi:hypothetical protein